MNVWQKTPVTNLVRNSSSGIYYARLFSKGKEKWKSLRTDLLEVAKAKLRELTGQTEIVAQANAAEERGRMTVNDCAVILRERLKQGYGAKGRGTQLRKITPGTRQFREETLAALFKSWPGLAEMDARKVSLRAVEQWADKFAPAYSETRYNGTLDTFRMLFRIAQDAGARFDNPIDRIGRATVKQKALVLPERPQFEAFVTAIRTAGGRTSRDCADFVEFLAYIGARKEEAANVLWSDVDFVRNRVHLRKTKGDHPRYVPLIADASALLRRMRDERLGEGAQHSVLRVNEAQKSMNAAAKKVGMARITHHDLRHLFATACIEAGVDIPTVSRWLGHRDGGALAMRTYGHLREEHSATQAQKVSFVSKVAASRSQATRAPRMKSSEFQKSRRLSGLWRFFPPDRSHIVF